MVRPGWAGNGAGRCMNTYQTEPEALAQAIAAESGARVSYARRGRRRARAARPAAELILEPCSPQLLSSELARALAGVAKDGRHHVPHGQPGGRSRCVPGNVRAGPAGSGRDVGG